MLRFQVLYLLILTLTHFGLTGLAKEPAVPEKAPAKSKLYIYVAPIVKHAPREGAFTTLAFTNTTQWWFNPSIRLVDREGTVSSSINPLMKGFGTWQGTTHRLLEEYFQGSVWILSPQPLVGSIYLQQLLSNGEINLVASSKLELVATENQVSEELLSQLQWEPADSSTPPPFSAISRD